MVVEFGVERSTCFYRLPAVVSFICLKACTTVLDWSRIQTARERLTIMLPDADLRFTRNGLVLDVFEATLLFEIANTHMLRNHSMFPYQRVRAELKQDTSPSRDIACMTHTQPGPACQQCRSGCWQQDAWPGFELPAKSQPNPRRPCYRTGRRHWWKKDCCRWRLWQSLACWVQHWHPWWACDPFRLPTVKLFLKTTGNLGITGTFWESFKDGFDRFWDVHIKICAAIVRVAVA